MAALYIIVFSIVFAGSSLAYALDYDPNGNLVKDDEFEYTYDGANRLKEVRDLDGGLVARYAYDSGGNRIKKELADGIVTYYPFDDYEETHYANGTVEKTTYYFASGERVAKKVQTGDSGPKTSYYHPDHLGSTSVMTDSSGQVVEKTKYYPFGAVLSGGSDRYGYTGQENDPESELMYYNARYYNPELLRFTQPDSMLPEVYDPQQLNRYAYVKNNPMRYKDPSGHFKLNVEGGEPYAIAEAGDTKFGLETRFISKTRPPAYQSTITEFLKAPWSFTKMTSFMKSMGDYLKPLDAGTKISISEHLGGGITGMLKSQYAAEQRGDTSPCDGKNCWGTALYLAGITDTHMYVGSGPNGATGELVTRGPADVPNPLGCSSYTGGLHNYADPDALLKSSGFTRTESPYFGDIIRFEKEGDLTHYSTYLLTSRAGDVYTFSKSGYWGPYEITTADNLPASYGPVEGIYRG